MNIGVNRIPCFMHGIFPVEQTRMYMLIFNRYSNQNQISIKYTNLIRFYDFKIQLNVLPSQNFQVLHL
jgi:hypothetical protein